MPKRNPLPKSIPVSGNGRFAGGSAGLAPSAAERAPP